MQRRLFANPFFSCQRVTNQCTFYFIEIACWAHFEKVINSLSRHASLGAGSPRIQRLFLISYLGQCKKFQKTLFWAWKSWLSASFAFYDAVSYLTLRQTPACSTCVRSCLIVREERKMLASRCVQLLECTKTRAAYDFPYSTFHCRRQKAPAMLVCLRFTVRRVSVCDEHIEPSESFCCLLCARFLFHFLLFFSLHQKSFIWTRNRKSKKQLITNRGASQLDF